MAYQRPMVTVDQNMTVTPTSIERDQPAFIFGPNYQLYRYDNAEEKANTKFASYNGTALTSGYPVTLSKGLVDADYTRVFGENAVIKIKGLGAATLPEETAALREKNGGYTQFLVSKDVTGDVKKDSKVRITYSYLDDEEKISGASFVTTVTSVVYKDSSFDYDQTSANTAFGPGTLIAVEDALVDKASVDVTDISVVAVVDSVEIPAKRPIGVGNAATHNWTATNETVTANAGMAVEYEDAVCDVLEADLYVTYRELDTRNASNISSVSGASNVELLLGAISPDNPLAMGVYMAALNAATDDGDETPPVYFMATPTDDKTGYASVLNKASLTDKIYVLAPTTRDESVLELVRSHVLSMSGKENKMWRIAAASAEIPASKAVLRSTDNVLGNDYYAIPLSQEGGDAVGKEDYFTLRITTSSANRGGNTDLTLKSDVVKGDIVRFGYHSDLYDATKDAYDEYIVDSVVNNFTIVVTSRIDVSNLKAAAAGYAPSKIEIWHNYTDAETAELVASTSRAMASRRMLNVFPTQFETDGVQMTGEFAACAVAGLVSAAEPQQPITNMSVRGIDSIPLTYQRFSKDQLDTMAAGGTFIVAQDLPEDKVYVRHQITTASPDGNLNTAELSITKNVDNIAYAFAELFAPYYGKYNITDSLLVDFESLATNLIDQFSGSTSVYGPQLIADETTINYIRQNELMKDHVDISISLGVPYPCNNIDIVLTV